MNTALIGVGVLVGPVRGELFDHGRVIQSRAGVLVGPVGRNASVLERIVSLIVPQQPGQLFHKLGASVLERIVSFIASEAVTGVGSGQQECRLLTALITSISGL